MKFPNNFLALLFIATLSQPAFAGLEVMQEAIPLFVIFAVFIEIVAITAQFMKK